MAFVIKTAKTLRNHWKKSTFGFVVLAYSVSSAKSRYDTNIFMQARCEEAMKFGEELLPVAKQPRTLTVILNPAANKRKAKTEYEKYCEPLFHLAGISVNLLHTQSEGHAKQLVENLPENESVVIAGGDGTFCETITGILRKDPSAGKRTIGIIPLGRRNYIGNKLFTPENGSSRAHQLTKATMAIIKNETQNQDILKIEAIETEQEKPGKPIYSVGPIEWGAFRDAVAKRDKYWMYGGFRDYATFVFNGYKRSLCWECRGTLKITPPCAGCNNCREVKTAKPHKFSWSNFILPKVESEGGEDFSKVANAECGRHEEMCFKTTEIDIVPMAKSDEEPAHLAIMLDKMRLGYFEFVKEGWNKVNNADRLDVVKPIKARTVELLPQDFGGGKEIWFNIDNEEFDVKPIKITLLPEAIRMYVDNKM